MSIELAKAYVQVVPTAKGIKGSLSKAIGGEADSAGESAGRSISGKIKGALAAAGIGVALGAGIKKSLTEGANLEQAIGGIETLFKDSSDEMIKNADKAFRTAGISANSYMEQATSFSASLLQSTGGDTKKAAASADQAIKDMSDNANKMGSNIEDIQNAYQGFAKQNYTMLDNLKLGYGGTKGEMERLLEDAQKISGQKYDISNLSDVYEAIHVIQGDLDITGTTAKEAASTLSGSFASMQAAADNLMADLTLGRNVGPAMADLADSAATYLFDNLFPAIGTIFKSLPEAISSFVRTGAPRLASAGMDLLKGLMNGIQTKVPELMITVPQMLSNAFDKIKTMAPVLIARGGDMVVGLITGMAGKIPGFVSTLAGAVSSGVSKMTEFIKANLPALAEKGGELLKNLAEGFLRNLPKIIAAVAKMGASILKSLVKLIPTIAKAGLNIAKGLVKGLGGGALSLIRAAAAKIASAIHTPVRAVVSKIKSIASSIKSALSFSGLASKVKGVFDKVKNAASKPIEKAKELIKSAIDKIKGLFPLSIGKIFSSLKLPHISVSGGKAPFGIAGKGSLPHFSVSWHRKAENDPYLFSSPTLFGAGEGTKDEILYGRQALMNDIRDAAGRNYQPAAVYNIGDVTLDVSRLEDVATLEDFATMLRRAKAFR